MLTAPESLSTSAERAAEALANPASAATGLKTIEAKTGVRAEVFRRLPAAMAICKHMNHMMQTFYTIKLIHILQQIVKYETPPVYEKWNTAMPDACHATQCQSSSPFSCC